MTKKRRPKNEARNREMLLATATGKTKEQVAKDFGVSRYTVGRAVASIDAKKMLAEADNEIKGLCFESIDVLKKALKDSDIKVSVDAATKILKSLGVLKDKLDISHAFPKPTIIRRLSGEIVEFTTAKEDE